MIQVTHLTKRYGNYLAVSDLSFSIEKGHIYGFLGPNGAGKSTTMNIITGCLSATEGTVKIGDYDIFEEPLKAKKLIGYLPEIPPLYIDQTPREYLYFVAEAKGVKKAEIAEEIEKVIEETHIEEVADRLIKQLSKGYRQRVGIAQALLGDPEVIILDEPTVGLDPMQIIEIRDLIKMLGKKHTVILSSHILSEVEAICEKVLIIHKGKLIAFDQPENLRKTLSGNATIELVCDTDELTARGLLKKIPGIVAMEKGDAKTGVDALRQADGKTLEEEITADSEKYSRVAPAELVVTVNDINMHSICKEIFFTFAKAEIALFKLNPVKADLEEIYIELTREGGADDESSLEA